MKLDPTDIPCPECHAHVGYNCFTKSQRGSIYADPCPPHRRRVRAAAAANGTESLETLAYQMARHIRNTDRTEPIKWGVDGMELLAKLRAMDPVRYQKEVSRQ